MYKLRLPGFIGYILSGVILGPLGFGLVKNDAIIDSLSRIAVVFLLFYIGLMEHPLTLRKHGMQPYLLGALMVTAVTAVSMATFLCGGQDVQSAIALGLVLSTPAASLLYLLKHESEDGTLSLIFLAAIAAEVYMFVLLGVALREGHGSLASYILRPAIFVAVSLLIVFAVPRLGYRILVATKSLRKYVQNPEAGFTIVVLLMFGMYVFAEKMGVRGEIGAFIAGLVLIEEVIGFSNYYTLKEKVSSFTNGFLLPIFLASMAVSITREALLSSLYYFTLSSAAMTIGTLAVSLVASRILGQSPAKLLVYLLTRGPVSFVGTQILYYEGLISAEVRAGLFLSLLVFSVAPPTIAKRLK